MTLAFVTTYGEANRTGWSGIGHYMARALERQGLLLEHIGPLQEKSPALATAKQWAYRAVCKRYWRDRDPRILRDFARQVAARLSSLQADVVFSPGTIPIAYVDCDAPIVVWTDATFAGMIGFYPEYSTLSAETLRGGNQAERSALERCRLAIYTSDWAAAGAVRHYGVDPGKVRVVPLGANVAREPTPDEVARAIRGRNRRPWRLLFLGRDWQRKGGEVAVEVTVALNEGGFPTRLTVVGCEPRLGDRARPHVEAVGRLETDRSSEHEWLLALLAQSHFMILPTLADCTPVAISEANAFGVPCLTTSVGGIPTVLRDGVNGKLFPAATAAPEYVAFITEVLTTPERYQALAVSSFAEYQARLNWRVAGEAVQRFLQEVV